MIGEGSRRLSRMAALTLVALAGFTGSAHAASSYSSSDLKANVTMDTTVVTPLTRRIVARINITAGAKRISFGVDADTPKFHRYKDGEVVKEGATLRPLRFRWIGRPERWTFDGSGYSPGGEQCELVKVGPQLPHGGGFIASLTRGLNLRPRQSVTMEVDYDVASDMPWIGTNYAPMLRLRPVSRGTRTGYDLHKGERELKRTVALRPPMPLVTGPFAARIDISNSWDADSKEPGVIKGAVVPAVAGRTVNFAAVRWSNSGKSSKPPVPIGSAVTTADGSFSLSVAGLSKKESAYAILPSYPAQTGGLLADSPCPYYFATKKSPQPPFTP